MKTSYEEILSLPVNEVLKKASEENLIPSKENKERILFIGIDVQQDFMDGGALGVPGAMDDVGRMTRFLYEHMDKITDIAVSLDTHTPHQIFHPCWWEDENGCHPDPYTVITSADLHAGKWSAPSDEGASREYVEHLEQEAKKALCIWPYHCLEGTPGAAMEDRFAKMVYFHSVAKKSRPQRIQKGQDPLSEMYGIIRPEYDTKGYKNQALLDWLAAFDRIYVAGEAKSHCVLESVRQILEHYELRPEVTEKIYILEDCMSSIPGYEEMTEETLENFAEKYHIKRVRSTDPVECNSSDTPLLKDGK